MALHPDSPRFPHAILDQEVRWFSADESLRETGMDKLMPPPGADAVQENEGVARRRLRERARNKHKELWLSNAEMGK
jgi:dephospho-CoA kinase